MNFQTTIPNNRNFWLEKNNEIEPKKCCIFDEKSNIFEDVIFLRAIFLVNVQFDAPPSKWTFTWKRNRNFRAFCYAVWHFCGTHCICGLLYQLGTHVWIYTSICLTYNVYMSGKSSALISPRFTEHHSHVFGHKKPSFSR